jgi:hypothetical protein
MMDLETLRGLSHREVWHLVFVLKRESQIAGLTAPER